MATTNTEFVDHAQPYAWLLAAENLHSQALCVYGSFGNTTISRVEPDGTSRTWDQSNCVMFLLAGFALENLIKSFLVYENPTWIENGKLNEQLRSHSLTKLANKSKLLPYKIRGRVTLETLEDGLESWARYPCALTAAKTKEQLTFNPILWNAYLQVSHYYASKLTKLLGRKWNGPHGFNGLYEISDDFFSFRPPTQKTTKQSTRSHY
jgi:hypothetical protein